MKLDTLKSAWAALDHKLDSQNALLLQQARRSRLQSLRHKLRPLAWGQTLQMLLGVPVILLGVSAWQAGGPSHLVVAGIIVHVYGIAMILLGGLVHGSLARFDLDAPVLAVQQRLARLHRLYVIGGTTLGLAWWVLWIPFMMTLFALVGADFYRGVGAPVIAAMTAGGVLGLLATWAFDRWARRRPELHRKLRRAMAGESLARATAELEALQRFERE